MHRANRRDKQGVVMFIVLITVLILIVMAISYGEFVATNYSSVKVQTEVMQARYIAEAAANMKVGQIILNSAGYEVDEDDEAVIEERTLGKGAYTWTVTENADESVTVRAVGSFEGSERFVEVVLQRGEGTGRFAMALFGDVLLSAGGNFFTDSYNSTLGAYGGALPDGGTNTGDNGDLGTNGTMTIFGSGEAHGDVIVTSPPYTAATAAALQAALYAAGQLAPPNVVTIKPKVVLDSVTYTPPIGVNTTINQNSNYVWNSSGDPDNPTIKRASTLKTNTGSIQCNGHTVLYVDSNIDLKGAITINANSSLKIIQGAGTFTVNGQALVNTTNNPLNLQIESASTEQVKLNGGGDFYGTIYAPDAPVLFNGNNTMFGSIVADTINVVGTATFHYDESLADLGGDGDGTFGVFSWQGD